MWNWTSVKESVPKASGLYDVIIDGRRRMIFCEVTESGCNWETATVDFWKPHERIEYDFQKY